MIIAYSSLCCKFIEDILEIALKNKDNAIEWDFNFIPPVLSNARTSFLKDFLQENGIKISFHLPYSFYEIADEDQQIRDNSITVIERHIKYIADLSTSAVDAILHVGTTPSSNIDIACASLERLSNFASDKGVTICVENLITGLTVNPQNIKEMLKVKGIRFCFDMGHADVVSKSNPYYYDMLAEIINNCQHAHVYKTEKNLTHVPFENIFQLKNTMFANASFGSNCKWITLELETLHQQQSQENLWREYLIGCQYI